MLKNILSREWKSPMRRSNESEALASRKVAVREDRTEVSGTAKVGTNEQELNKRL